MKILDRTWPNGDSTAIWADFKDGFYQIKGHDMGPGLEKFTGKDELDYGLRISETDMQRVWPHLMQHVLSAQEPLKFGAFVELCTSAGINPDRWSH